MVNVSVTTSMWALVGAGEHPHPQSGGFQWPLDRCDQLVHEVGVDESAPALLLCGHALVHDGRQLCVDEGPLDRRRVR